jgi:hypothetical protein
MLGRMGLDCRLALSDSQMLHLPKMHLSWMSPKGSEASEVCRKRMFGKNIEHSKWATKMFSISLLTVVLSGLLMRNRAWSSFLILLRKVYAGRTKKAVLVHV